MSITSSPEFLEAAKHTDNIINEMIADGTKPELDHIIFHHFFSDDPEALEEFLIATLKADLSGTSPEFIDSDDEDFIPDLYEEEVDGYYASDIVFESPLEKEAILEQTKLLLELLEGHPAVGYIGWGSYLEDGTEEDEGDLVWEDDEE